MCWDGVNLRTSAPIDRHSPVPALLPAHTAGAPKGIIAATSDAVVVTAEPADACAGRFASPPCGTYKPHCRAFTKFRFFLQPAEEVVSQAAVDLYKALLAHPLRTESEADACVGIGEAHDRTSQILLEVVQ